MTAKHTRPVGSGRLAAGDPGYYGPGGDGGRNVATQGAKPGGLAYAAGEFGYRLEGPDATGTWFVHPTTGHRLHIHEPSAEWTHRAEPHGGAVTGFGADALRRRLRDVYSPQVVDLATQGTRTAMAGAAAFFDHKRQRLGLRGPRRGVR